MNIALFTDTYFPDINGVASSIYTMANGLIAKGHRVYIFSISAPSKKIKLVEDNPPVFRVPSLPVLFVKPYRTVRPVFLTLVEMCKKYKIDIVHTHSEFSMGIMGGMIADTLGVPHIHTYHTMLEDYTHYVGNGKFVTPKMARKYSEIFCEGRDALIVPTEKVLNAVKSYGVDVSTVKTFIIPSGINLKPFKPSNYDNDSINQIRENFGIKPTDKVLLSIGRIAKEKSLDIVITHFPEILKKIPDALLVIIGRGPATEELKELANNCGVSDRVFFPGSVPYSEVGKYYQIGDVFISCSTSETQGLTYYEALAAALPVIAIYDECISDVLTDGVNSRLFRDPNDLPNAVFDVLSDSSKMSQMSRAASDSVANFDAEIFADRIEEAYIETINIHKIHHITRDANPARHIIYKMRAGMNKTMTLYFNGTKKVFKPFIRKTRNINRKVNHNTRRLVTKIRTNLPDIHKDS